MQNNGVLVRTQHATCIDPTDVAGSVSQHLCPGIRTQEWMAVRTLRGNVAGSGFPGHAEPPSGP